MESEMEQQMEQQMEPKTLEEIEIKIETLGIVSVFKRIIDVVETQIVPCLFIYLIYVAVNKQIPWKYIDVSLSKGVLCSFLFCSLAPFIDAIMIYIYGDKHYVFCFVAYLSVLQFLVIWRTTEYQIAPAQILNTLISSAIIVSWALERLSSWLGQPCFTKEFAISVVIPYIGLEIAPRLELMLLNVLDGVLTLPVSTWKPIIRGVVLMMIPIVFDIIIPVKSVHGDDNPEKMNQEEENLQLDPLLA